MPADPAKPAQAPTTSRPSFARLKSLKCFLEVRQMLLGGWPALEVARFVRDVRGEGTDVAEVTLSAEISAYRRSLPPAELLAGVPPSSTSTGDGGGGGVAPAVLGASGTPVVTRLPLAFTHAAKRVREGLDELKELERLYGIQMERVEIDFATEKKIGKLFPSMTAEIRAAREILEKRAQLKMDLGLDERHLGRLEVDTNAPPVVVERYGAEVVKHAVASPESRRKLLGVVERLTQLQQLRDRVSPGESGGAGPATPPEDES